MMSFISNKFCSLAIKSLASDKAASPLSINSIILFGRFELEKSTIWSLQKAPILLFSDLFLFENVISFILNFL